MGASPIASNDNKTFTIVPASALVADTTFKRKITSSATDLAGNAANYQDSSGMVTWSTKLIGTSSKDEAFGLETDEHSNVYIVGYTQGNLLQTKTSGQDGFLYKFNKFGNNLLNLQWGQIDWYEPTGGSSGSSDTSEKLFSVIVSNNQVWIAGENSNQALIRHSYDNGTLIWPTREAPNAQKSAIIITGGGYPNSSFKDIAIDNNSNIYGVGWSANPTSLGGELYGQTYNGGDSDILVMKYNSSGTRQWTKLFGSNQADEGLSVATSNGYVYIAGYTRGTMVHAPSCSCGAYNAIVIKLDNSSGTEIWKYQFQADLHSSVFYNSIVTDNESNVYIAGEVGGGAFSGNSSSGQNDYFFAKLNSDGQLQFVKQFGTNLSERAYAIAKDNSNNFYITGTTQGSFSGFSNAGSDDIFLSKHYDNGTLQWTKQFGSNTADYAYDLEVDDKNGHIYIIGTTHHGNDTSNKGSFDGKARNGDYDVILMKYDLDGNKF